MRVGLSMMLGAALWPVALFSQEPALVREGPDWVRTATATFSVAPQTRLQVASRGRIAEVWPRRNSGHVHHSLKTIRSLPHEPDFTG